MPFFLNSFLAFSRISSDGFGSLTRTQANSILNTKSDTHEYTEA